MRFRFVTIRHTTPRAAGMTTGSKGNSDLAARIKAQTHAVADVDTPLAQISGAFAETTKCGRTEVAHPVWTSRCETVPFG